MDTNIMELDNLLESFKIDMLTIEHESFMNIMHMKQDTILTEAVLQEAEQSKLEKIKNTIKEFFKNLWEKIKKFFSTIREALRKFFKPTEEEKDKKAYEKFKAEVAKKDKSEFEEVVKLKLTYFNADSYSDLISKSENDVKFYSDKVHGFINNSEVKKIIDFVTKEGNNLRDEVDAHPEWKKVTHTDYSNTRMRGEYTKSREDIIHIYDEYFTDIEKYVPFAGEPLKMKQDNSGKSDKLHQIKRITITSESNIDELYKTIFKDSSANLERVVNSVKKVEKTLSLNISEFEKSLSNIKNFGPIVSESINKIMSILNTTVNKVSTISRNTSKNVTAMNRYNLMIYRKVTSMYNGTADIGMTKDEEGNRVYTRKLKYHSPE